MSFRIWNSLIGFLVFAAPLHPAESPGWVSAAGSFVISNTTIPVDAGPVILAFGDEIVAGGTAAILMLRGQGRFILEKHSAVKVERRRDFVVLHVVEGRLSYDLTPDSKTAIFIGTEEHSTGHKLTGSAATLPKQEDDPSLPPRTRDEPISDPRFRPPSPSQP